MEKKEKVRCGWCLKDDLYMYYHDNEWGQPSHDDLHLFEHLVLETFQAGLSWHTILKRRHHFHAAFEGFDPQKISGYGDLKFQELMNNEGIIRNKAKINATINNAKRFLEVQKEFGSFDKYVWQFVGNKPIVKRPANMKDYEPTSTESLAMSKDMKKRGFSFVGPTGCYAFMQAVGMIDEHMKDCWRTE
jgi:DNA-3-methyladenine glycosylase I